MNVDRNTPVHMIGTDGGLRIIPSYLANDMKERGWKIVNNPKRTYFPELDKTSPHYKPEETTEDMDMLPLDLI
jgi:hypothetical protein